jgi:formate dehydrogenase major subunit
MHVSPHRWTKVRYRRPYSSEWEDLSLDEAMDMIADRVKKTRDETFIERLPNGRTANMTPAIFSLGGATLNNEWNHTHQKLMRGLGIVAIENQARI